MNKPLRNCGITLFVIVFGLLTTFTEAQNICPTDVTYCSSTFTTPPTNIVLLQCGGYGSLDRLPPVCSDTRSISKLVLDPTNMSVSQIPASAFAGLQIAELQLSNLGISSLDSNTFLGLGAFVQTIHLNNNNLTDLPSALFSTLVNLLYLELQNNGLTELREELFHTLASITYINLANNFITSIAPTTFFMTSSLQQLQLQNNLIGNMTNQVFSKLGSLMELRLENNRLGQLNNETFQNCARLTSLNASFNSIDDLPDNLFSSNPSLQSLDLSHNAIENISMTAVRGLSQLATLLLNDNAITVIPEYVFFGLNVIAKLTLSNNNISSIKSNSFSGMPYLYEMHLDNNSIPVIPQGLLDPLGALLVLNMSNNEISNVQLNPFTALIQVTTIDLSNNHIKNVTQDWFPTAVQLTTLILHRNKISSIDASTFSATPQLTTLDLSDNLLSLDSLNGIFTGCTQLDTLRLSRNPLFTVKDGTFSALTGMTKLHLTSCCLQNVTFKSPLRLTELYLDHNFITSIQSSAFLGLSQLSTLQLGYNGLQYIETGAISVLPRLLLLNLTQNSLTDNIVVTTSPALTSQAAIVDLSENMITNLTGLQHFSQVYLAGNPLKCSCLAEIPWLSNALITTMLPDYALMTCSVMESISANNQISSQMRAVCYFTSSAFCSNDTASTSNIEAATNACNDNATSTFASTSALSKDIRAMDFARCGYKFTTTTTAPTTPTPVIMNMTVACTNWSLTVNWITNFNSGLVDVIVSKEIGNSSAAQYELLADNSKVQSHTFILQNGGNYTVCVRPSSGIPTTTPATTTQASVTTSSSSETGGTTGTTTPSIPVVKTVKEAASGKTGTASVDPKISEMCENITVLPVDCDATTTSWPQCQSGSKTNWLIYGIAIGVGLLLLLLIIIIIICLLVRRRKEPEKTRPGAGLKHTDSGLSQRGVGGHFQNTMAEQADMSVNISVDRSSISD